MLLLDSNFFLTVWGWTKNFPIFAFLLMIIETVGSKSVGASILGKWTWLKIHELFSNSVTILAKRFPALWALLQFSMTKVANDVAIWTLVDW